MYLEKISKLGVSFYVFLYLSCSFELNSKLPLAVLPIIITPTSDALDI